MSILDDVGSWLSNAANGLMHPHVAGVFGSLLSLRWAPGRDWGTRMFSFGCGIGCAVYGTPALTRYMNIGMPEVQLALSFLAGLLGMNIIAKAVDVVRTTDWHTLVTNLPGALAALRGKGKGDPQ